ncbi:hypothetical protein B566_EDAN012367 [Ephemera danica]|nr:hypothetical protein B566_EDAN012367 [Ephemera danica]
MYVCSLRTPAPGLDVGRVRRELRKALLVWQEKSLLNFTEVNSKDADILVHFFKGYHDDGYPFDGPGTVLAHAFFPGSGRGGDAHFDEQEKWLLIGDRGEEGTSLFNVAAHEFGHSLGLSHSSQREALMFPWYQGFNPATEFTLPPDDVNGIQQLYDACNTNYDAIAYIRRETFIFKGAWFWRIGDQGLYDGYPVQTTRFWHNLPHNFTHVDAVYERRHDKKIIFFIGNQYWLYDANQKEPGYPKPLTDLGLPESLDHVDGAMVWGHNGKTYFFSGTMYWRFDEEIGKVELDYPRDMSMWSGVGYNIDAVFQWKDGNTYFFKGNGYWKFNDQKMRTFQESPSLSAPFWMGCSQADELSKARPTNVGELLKDTSAAAKTSPSLLVMAVLCWLHASRRSD